MTKLTKEQKLSYFSTKYIKSFKLSSGQKQHGYGTLFWVSHFFEKPQILKKDEEVVGIQIRPYRITEKDIQNADPKSAKKLDDRDPGYVDFDSKSGNFHKRFDPEQELEFQVILLKDCRNGGSPGKPKEEFGEKGGRQKLVDEIEESERYFPNVREGDNTSTLDELIQKALGKLEYPDFK